MELIFILRALSVLCREVTQSDLSFRGATAEEMIGARKTAGQVGGYPGCGRWRKIWRKMGEWREMRERLWSV